MENEAYNLLRGMGFTTGWLLVGCYILGAIAAFYFIAKFFKWVFKY